MYYQTLKFYFWISSLMPFKNSRMDSAILGVAATLFGDKLFVPGEDWVFLKERCSQMFSIKGWQKKSRVNKYVKMVVQVLFYCQFLKRTYCAVKCKYLGYQWLVANASILVILINLRIALYSILVIPCNVAIFGYWPYW